MLDRFGLPAHPEQKPNDYFPLLPALQFGTTAQSSQGIADFGFRATQRMHFRHLSSEVQAAVRHAPTLFTVLEQWCRYVQIEDNFARYWLERHGDQLRVCNTISGTAGVPHLEHTQWVQNVMMVYVIRQFAGPNWTPTTIAFEARYTPGPETRSLWPHTRFLSGQKVSWIDLPVALLSLPNPAKSATSGPSEREFGRIRTDTDTVTALKMMLALYLDERPPGIAAVAEIAGTSVRSFQRDLARAGLTYSGLLDQVRFEKGAELLRNTDAKIIDVAFATGYTDPAHFTRAFRRIAGMTPREFRETSSGA
jgi:AraC-like DNA-binding protein